MLVSLNHMWSASRSLGTSLHRIHKLEEIVIRLLLLWYQGWLHNLGQKQTNKTGLQPAADKAEKGNTRRTPALDKGKIFPRCIWHKLSLAR